MRTDLSTILKVLPFVFWLCLVVWLMVTIPPPRPHLLDALIVYDPPLPKRRYGPSNDGGYVLCDGLSYDFMVSAGINGDIRFEEAFLDVHTQLACHAFDGTDESFPNTTKNIQFHAINVGPANTSTTTDLKYILDAHKDVFVKMDIEGSEWDWFESLSDLQLNNIKQMVVEFHHPLPLDSKKWGTLSRLAEHFFLVHIHANNNEGVDDVGGVSVPRVFECTYLRKDVVVTVKPNVARFPDPRLDSKNNVNADDIELATYPYVRL